MKNTNILSISVIPNNWEIKKVKHLFYLSKEKANDKNPVVLKLARKAVEVRDISTNEGQLAESYENYNPVLNGDLLLNPMDLYSGANCNVSNVCGVISPAYANLRKLDSNTNSKYFDYFFKTQYWCMAMFAHGKGVSYDNRWTMNAESILNYQIPVPPVKVQDAIAKYLDNKLLNVDLLIQNEEQQIEKILDYKDKIIFEKIFEKYLSDENIEFLWTFPTSNKKRLKDIILKHFGGCWGEEYHPNLSPSVCIRIADFDFNTQTCNNAETIRYYTEKQINNSKLEDGDIILEKSGGGEKTPVGRTVVFQNNKYEQAMFANFCECLRINSKVANSRYVAYFLKAFYKTVDMRCYFHQTTGIQNIDIDSILSVYIPVPSLKDQIELVKLLDQKSNDIDDLVSKKREKINLLNSYKKSLIYECVTGKKEVMA